MKRSMLIKTGRISKHHICPSCNIGEGSEVLNELIPAFYNEQHAYDEGWRKTKHVIFCPPEEDYVWVCPECWPNAKNEGLTAPERT